MRTGTYRDARSTLGREQLWCLVETVAKEAVIAVIACNQTDEADNTWPEPKRRQGRAGLNRAGQGKAGQGRARPCNETQA